jgi:hypothetical protein
MKTYREILLEFKGEFHRGDRVEGKYIDGSPYTGSVVDRRFHTKNSNLLIYTVKLDVPITKAKRDSIMITWDIKKDMPKNDATMKPSKSKLSTAKANCQGYLVKQIGQNVKLMISKKKLRILRKS